MTKEQERHEQIQKAQLESHRQQAERIRREEREKYINVVSPDDDNVCCPLGKPDSLYYKVAVKPGIPTRFMNRHDYRFYDVKEHLFRVRQYAHRLPDGTTVIWYGLEHCG